MVRAAVSGEERRERDAMRRPCLLAVFLSVVWATVAAAQPVQGQVDTLGFQATNASVVRLGQWFPILVSLKSQGSQPFAGELRAEDIDLDGDRVAFTRPQVTVSGEAGPPRTFWCYGVTNSLNELPQNIDVVSQDGALVLQMPLPPCAQLLCDDLVVLDLSAAKITSLNALQTPSWSPGQPTAGMRPFYRSVVPVTLPRGARDLPDRWWGLEAVNVIIWDQPDPAVLSIPQRDALLEWVRNGGQLIVGVGATWGALSKSDLAPILPLTGEGTLRSVQRLDIFQARMAWADRAPPGLREPIPVILADLAPGAFRTLGDFGPGNEPINLITMRLVGSGRVVATAAGLRDLASAGADPQKVFAALIDLNPHTKEFLEKEVQTAQISLFPSTPLYDDIVKQIGFGGQRALRGLTAFLFVGLYVGLATLASWWWLRGRKLTHLSWTVFAAFAVVASALSLATVGALRGFSRVHSVCVLDTEAGATVARGYCLFGYRSPTRQLVELSLPGDNNFLRPLARNPKSTSFYVTPARYAAIPAKATLADVLMRATLKQVEGYWHGELSGALRAQLTADRATGRLTPTSWIASDLGVDIDGGVLVFIDPRLQDGAQSPPWRVNGLTRPYELPEEDGGKGDLKYVPPAVNILAVPVPRIPAGQRVDTLGHSDYQRVDERLAQWGRQADRKRSDRPDLPTLWADQQAWSGNTTFPFLGTGLSPALNKLLLAATRNYHLHNRSSDFNSVGVPVTSEGLPDLDVTHWLARGQAVLLCWSNAPGPARLYRNGRQLETDEGLTFYRVRLPLDYEGVAPRGGATP